MRLNSSTQPTSTRRSPRRGSRPVVSVSRTISRMGSLPTSYGESGSPLRHLNDCGQNVLDLRAHGAESAGRIHDEIGALALFSVGHLPGEDGIEFFVIHGPARQHPLA